MIDDWHIGNVFVAIATRTKARWSSSWGGEGLDGPATNILLSQVFPLWERMLQTSVTSQDIVFKSSGTVCFAIYWTGADDGVKTLWTLIVDEWLGVSQEQAVGLGKSG